LKDESKLIPKAALVIAATKNYYLFILELTPTLDYNLDNFSLDFNNYNNLLKSKYLDLEN
jgi:hypothetical protein